MKLNERGKLWSVICAGASIFVLSAVAAAQTFETNGMAVQPASNDDLARSIRSNFFTSEDKKWEADQRSPLPFFPRSELSKPNRRRNSSSDSGWHFAVAPYLFAAGISGTVAARGQSINIDSSFGNVWSHLDAGFMTAFEARKKRFVIGADLIWVKLSAERDTPGGLFGTAKVGVNLFIFDPEAGYRLIDHRKGTVDVLAGARIWSVNASLTATAGRLPGFDVSQRKTFAAPVVGVRGIYNLPHKFYLFGKFDIGGAGIGADITTQMYGGVGYKITNHVALIGGYRWLQVKYDDSQGFVYDTHMSGLMFGAKFSF